MPLRPLDFSRRKKWQIVAGIARQKIVDIVFARIHSGHERRPCHRRNRRKRRAQFAECSFVPQLRQVRQPSFIHEASGEIWIHAVESQNYRALKRRLSISISPPQETEQLAKRPRHQRVERIEERNKDRPERRQHGKSRTRPGVGMSKRRQENEGYQQDPCGAGAPAREMTALQTEQRATTP